MNYFKDCQCIEDVKTLYKKLCFKFHPDVSTEPNACEIMKEVNKQYDEAFKRLKNVFRNKEGEIYEDSKPVSEAPEDFRNIISKLIILDGLKIELIGRWIWVSGNTKEHKETLKSLKFRWCKNKGAWSWHRSEDSTVSKGGYTLNEIRDKYGFTVYENSKGTKQKQLEVVAG